MEDFTYYAVMGVHDTGQMLAGRVLHTDAESAEKELATKSPNCSSYYIQKIFITLSRGIWSKSGGVIRF